VGERYVDEGAMLAANTSIVSVLDTSVLIAVIHVIEKDYPRIRQGQQAEIDTDALPGRLFACKVARIAPLLKETTRTGRIELEVPNAEGLLKPGMFVRVKIHFVTIENALCVPIEAIITRRGQSGVFVLQEGLREARFIPVRQGITAGGLVQLLEPEIKGSVVVLGHHLLEDGSAVFIPEKARGPKQAPVPAKRTGPSP
jgi:RND family efflux transporter MFP subunit